MSGHLSRPQESEYNSYYEPYISVVSDDNIVDVLRQQNQATQALLREVSEGQASFRYAPGKWSLKEVIGHMADTERIMAYRLLTIARGGTAALPGFEQNDYVENAHFDQCELSDLLANLAAVRESTLALLTTIPSDVWLKSAPVSGHETTVRALAYIIAGHELHHFSIIRDRYLSAK